MVIMLEKLLKCFNKTLMSLRAEKTEGQQSIPNDNSNLVNSHVWENKDNELDSRYYLAGV